MPNVSKVKSRGFLFTIFCLVLGILLFGLLFPKIIDSLFSVVGIPLTQLNHIDANNLLVFWSSLFVIGSTLLLALVTLKQNERLMNLEESKLLPFIVVDGTEFIVEQYHELSFSDDLYNKMKFVYTNPNAEISFNVKNISDMYISRIIISNVSIIGFVASQYVKPIEIFESKYPQKSLLETSIEQNESKRISLGFENNHSFGICDLYLVVFTCELIHLRGNGSTFQTIQFQVGNNKNNFSIIGKSTFDPKSFFSHLSS